MCVSVLPAFVSVCTTFTKCPQRPEEGVRSPGTGITEGCELPRGYWELNLGPLEEQPVYLTTEPSLQLPMERSFLSYCFKCWSPLKHPPRDPHSITITYQLCGGIFSPVKLTCTVSHRKWTKTWRSWKSCPSLHSWLGLVNTKAKAQVSWYQISLLHKVAYIQLHTA